jgi:hypothetical protein
MTVPADSPSDREEPLGSQNILTFVAIEEYDSP